jgi:ribosomal protein S18 acetylase RimI-like enzyme
VGRVNAYDERDLYRRSVETVLACWDKYARAACGAAVQRFLGVTAAVFPSDPERTVYNNAILERELGATDRAAALDAMEAAYASAGVTRFAAWVHETDRSMRADLERRGYSLSETTRAMGMALEEMRLPRPEIELGSTGWNEYLRIFGLPPGLLSRGDHRAFHLLVARVDGENVATAMAFDHNSDCGIYNVATLQHARRRGLATALTAVQLHNALERGCRTASVQATKMAERVYGTIGFRDLGRILEYVPSNYCGRPAATEGASMRKHR